MLFSDNVYRILYEEVDESSVDIFSCPSHNRHNGDVEEFRFPRAGTANARSILRMVQFKINERPGDSMHKNCDSDLQDTGNNFKIHSIFFLYFLIYLTHLADGETEREEENQAIICDVQWFDLRRPLEEEFPWLEYIPRIGWTPCGQ